MKNYLYIFGFILTFASPALATDDQAIRELRPLELLRLESPATCGDDIRNALHGLIFNEETERTILSMFNRTHRPVEARTTIYLKNHREVTLIPDSNGVTVVSQHSPDDEFRKGWRLEGEVFPPIVENLGWFAIAQNQQVQINGKTEWVARMHYFDDRGIFQKTITGPKKISSLISLGAGEIVVAKSDPEPGANAILTYYVFSHEPGFRPNVVKLPEPSKNFRWFDLRKKNDSSFEVVEGALSGDEIGERTVFKGELRKDQIIDVTENPTEASQ